MRRRHVWTAGAAIVVSLASLAACAPVDSGEQPQPRESTGELLVWVQDAEVASEALASLSETFAATFPGWTLTVESAPEDTGASWSALAAEDVPDIVELDAQALPASVAAGELRALSDATATVLRTPDVAPGLVEAATVGDATYGAPYRPSARVVFASRVAAGDEMPTTLDELVGRAETLTTGGRSGLFAPALDWRGGLSWVWAAGGELAVFANDRWDAQFASEASIAGLTLLQRTYVDATATEPTATVSDGVARFCEGDVSYLFAPTWVDDELSSGDEGGGEAACAASDSPAYTPFALPGQAGQAAPVVAEGTVWAVPARSNASEQAEALVAMMLAPDFQASLARAGEVPALVDAAAALPSGDTVLRAEADAVAAARALPSTPLWAEVEQSQAIASAFEQIANGGDVAQIASDLDAEIEAILND